MQIQNKELLKITEKASVKAKQLLSNKIGSIGLRISVASGGCSGMTYKVDYATEINDNDEVVEKLGIKFIIDPSATMFLLGCTIDWKEEKFKNGFSFENPNETARCGCGESFSV